jgi:hypothetical protein
MMRRRFLKGAAVVAALSLFLFGLIRLGQLALGQIRGQSRHTIAFADIDCVPPPGKQRDAFLAEVQYLAEMPKRLRMLDEGLAKRLAAAFTRHPRVAQVVRVELTPPGQVHIRLLYRTPVLAIPVADQLRAVDGQGVLLPPDTPTKGLPVFPGQAASPKGPAGTRWGDPAVEAAARAATRAGGG